VPAVDDVGNADAIQHPPKGSRRPARGSTVANIPLRIL
jgi:hypothetical protein